MALAVGIDVGGTNLRAALVDERGGLVRVHKQPIGPRQPAAVLAQMQAAVASLGAEAKGAPMAVGFAAQLLLEAGVVAVAPAFGWRDVPMGSMLEQAFGQRVRLVNDLDAITYGEARAGAGRAARHLLCVFVGTGVGMGALVEGRLLEGADGLGTELGHTKVDSPVSGRLCGCGERGCLEAYTSGRHLPELYAQKIAQGMQGSLLREAGGDLARIHAGSLERAATSGDAAAVSLWADVGERLGTAIGNLVTLFNPRVVILGGGVLGSALTLHEATVRQIRAVAARPAMARAELRGAELGDDAGLVGAGLIALAS